MDRHPSFWAKVILIYLFFVFFPAANGAAQDRLSKLEWFIEGGGSFLNLGNQPNEVSILGITNSAYLVSPDHFTSGGLFFTGLRYHLTARDALEASHDESFWNYFQIQPTTVNTPAVCARFERNEYSFNYVRYLSRRGTLQPFVTAGLGAIESNTLATGYGQFNLSANFGVGTDIPINERLAFRVEMRDHVGWLPAPLRGTSHDLSPTAGLVFSPQTSTSKGARFPQVEVFLEGGASVLTGESRPAGQAGILNSSGPQDVDVVQIYSYSKTGRLLAGFRVMFSENSGVELSYSESPNRYEMQGTVPALAGEVLYSEQVTLDVEHYEAVYVRYLPWGKSVRPFITTGAGVAHFAGVWADIDKFGWHAGIGADVPLWKRLVARAELRDYMSRQPGLPNASSLGVGIVHNIAPTAGLAYRFK